MLQRVTRAVIERSELYAKTTEEFDSTTREAAETNPDEPLRASVEKEIR